VAVKTVSSSRIIPKEQFTAFQRWELHPFADKAQTPANTEAVFHEARQRGFEEGYRTGMQEGLAAAAKISAAESARLATLLASASAGMGALGSKAARETVDLAMAMARQMVRRELSLAPDAVLTMVREAMACMPQETRYAQLHLHPMDAELVQLRIGDELAHSQWRVVEDERMSPGGCRIEAACGDVDATFETRWASILGAIETSDELLRR
jgi:flagellar assembly protein FliH